MTLLPKDFKEFLQLLIAHNVQYQKVIGPRPKVWGLTRTIIPSDARNLKVTCHLPAGQAPSVVTPAECAPCSIQYWQGSFLQSVYLA